MEAAFLKILNMSIAAGWIILAAVLLRPALKKAPKAAMCALWAFAALRLVCPVSFESVLSLVPSAETVSPDIVYAQVPELDSGIPFVDEALNPIISGALAPEAGASANPMQLYTRVAAAVWLAGLAGMLGYAAVSAIRLRRRLRASIAVQERVYLCDAAAQPLIFGLFRPKIYLPSGIGADCLPYVLAHENAHLSRRDHLWKPLGFLILGVHWFNPLCWLAYFLFCRDIELACDEKVVRELGTDGKKAYAEALLACSSGRGGAVAGPLAFGETGVKERIKSVLHYKKPAFWVAAAAVAACIAVAAGFLTNPPRSAADVPSPDYKIESRPWEFVLAQSGADGAVVACSAEQKPFYENAAAADLAVECGDGKIVLKNQGTNEAWELSYRVDSRNISGIIYELSYGGQTGYASTGITRYHGGGSEYTLFLAFENYSIRFRESCQTYAYGESPEAAAPALRLRASDRSFQFSHSVQSSYMAAGSYQFSGETLTCRTDDGENAYVFRYDAEADTLVFDASRSSQIPDSLGGDRPVVPDGAVFRRR